MSDYGQTTGVPSPTEAEDVSSSLCVQTSSEAYPASCTMSTGGPFPGVKRGQGLMLTTHPHLVFKLRMSRSYASSPPQAPSWRVTGQLYLHLQIQHLTQRSKVLFQKLIVIQLFKKYSWTRRPICSWQAATGQWPKSHELSLILISYLFILVFSNFLLISFHFQTLVYFLLRYMFRPIRPSSGSRTCFKWLHCSLCTNIHLCISMLSKIKY
jgi:hypothetical protein